MAGRATLSLASFLIVSSVTAAPGQDGGQGAMRVAQANPNPISASVGTRRPIEVKAQPIEKPLQFMFGLFDAQKPEIAPLTEDELANDRKWEDLAKRRRYKIKPEFQPTSVVLRGYVPGTIVIDTRNRYLYFVESPATAIRYGIAVGKEGLAFTGKAEVGDKRVWPSWTPTSQMIEREPGRYRRYAKGMDGGVSNPLGARAIYLHQGRDDTYLRIHGTNQPQTIGTASSNGCFRMHNEHVIDLYRRVKVGAQVVVL